MDYRRLEPSDFDQVTDLAIRGMRPNLYPLHLARWKVRATVEHFHRSATDFHLVAFDDAKPVAAIAVKRQELLFFERQEAIVVMLFSTVTGAGFRLLRAAIEWFRADPMLRRLIWPLEFDADPRLLRISERMGFNTSNVNLSIYKV